MPCTAGSNPCHPCHPCYPWFFLRPCSSVVSLWCEKNEEASSAKRTGGPQRRPVLNPWLLEFGRRSGDRRGASFVAGLPRIIPRERPSG